MAKLTTKERKGLPTKVFGLPEKRAYPMEDKAHAKAALSRAAANATPAEDQRIKAKAKRMYPGMAVAGDAGKLHSLSGMLSTPVT
jgi:hypothetical protein